MSLQLRVTDRQPILSTAVGRQRVDKTVLLKTAFQCGRILGNSVRFRNDNQPDRSLTLSVFFPDAEEIVGGGIEDSVAWMEARIEDRIVHGYGGVLDVGDRAGGFAKLVKEVLLLDVVDISRLKHPTDEWAVRWNEPEGKFISAVLRATGMLGQLLTSRLEKIEVIAAESRAAAEQEVALLRSAIQGAEHVMLQGEFAVRQARQVQAGVVVERKHMTTRIIKETLPLFADKLQSVLVSKEQEWNEKQSLKRNLSAGYILLGIFLAGFSCVTGRITWRSAP